MSDIAAEPANPNDIRPVVAAASASNLGLWVFLGVLALGGVLIFNALSASREAAQTPSIQVPANSDAGRITSPPRIGVPARFLEPEISAQRTQVAAQQPVTLQRTPPQPITPPPSFVPTFTPPPEPFPVPAPAPAGPRVVFESQAPVAAAASSADSEKDAGRVKAGRFANPSRTIPQGTVIPAVLETAMDSTRPGGVRALVQRNVLGFDGSRVLIPRGSRLYGQYEANLQAGQNRAMVQWTRLIRPDGVTIALDSPSSDPLGRAGIRGKVDSKFLQRFGGAVLQSVLDIGVGLAVNEATDGVIVALPGSTQNVQITEPQSIQPTLKVKHGTSVSVFVARDLDFSSVDP